MATSTATVLCAVLFSSVVALPYNVKHPSSTSKTPDIILKNATGINYLYISNTNLLDHIILLVYKSVLFFFLHGTSALEGLDLLKDLPPTGSFYLFINQYYSSSFMVLQPLKALTFSKIYPPLVPIHQFSFHPEITSICQSRYTQQSVYNVKGIINGTHLSSEVSCTGVTATLSVSVLVPAAVWVAAADVLARSSVSSGQPNASFVFPYLHTVTQQWLSNNLLEIR